MLLFIIVLASCSQQEPNDDHFVLDGEIATLYTGSFFEAYPTSPIELDPLPEPLTLLHDVVSFEIVDGKEETRISDHIDWVKLTFNLFFTKKAAEMEIDSIGELTRTTVVAFTRTYKYTPGVYRASSQHQQDLTLVYQVSENRIDFAYVDANNLSVLPMSKLYTLDNYTRKAMQQTSETAQIPFATKYKGRFNVKFTDVATMENEGFIFEFNPLSGWLKEVEPINRDLLKLEVSDQKLIPTE